MLLQCKAKQRFIIWSLKPVMSRQLFWVFVTIRFESFHLPITGCRFSPKNIGWIAEKSWSRSPEEETKDREGADAGAAAGHAGEDAAEEAAADQDDRLPEFEILDLVEGFTLVLPE